MHPLVQVPFGFVYYGILVFDGGTEEIGLKLIPDYIVRLLKLYGNSFGAAQPRGRVYILMLEDCSESEMDRRMLIYKCSRQL